MEWIGHEDYETMMIYNHYSPSGFEVDMLNQAIERCEPGGPNLTPISE